MENFWIYVMLINFIAFVVYGIDKWKAVHHKYRVSEKTLIGLAVIGGSIGAFFGMQVFRHKTKHLKFVVGVPAIFLIQVITVIIVSTSMFF